MSKWFLLFSLLCLSAPSPVQAYSDQNYIDEFMREISFALLPGFDKKMRRDLSRNKLSLIGGNNIDIEKFKTCRRDVIDALADLDFLQELSLERLELTYFSHKLLTLSKLESLSLKENNLYYLPSEIAQFKKLKRINLAGNPLNPDGGSLRWGDKEINEWLAGKRTPQLQHHPESHPDTNYALRHQLVQDWRKYHLILSAFETSKIEHKKILDNQIKENYSHRTLRLIHYNQYKNKAVVEQVLRRQNPTLREDEINELMELYILYRFDYYPPVVYTAQALDEMMPFLLDEE